MNQPQTLITVITQFNHNLNEEGAPFFCKQLFSPLQSINFSNKKSQLQHKDSGIKRMAILVIV